MKNFIFLIFSLLLIQCKQKQHNNSKLPLNEFQEVSSFLESKNIKLDWDSGYIFFIPGSCIACNPWILDTTFSKAENLFTISSQPHKYLKNFTYFYYDNKNSFADLSFFQMDPFYIYFNRETKKVQIHRKVTQELLIRTLNLKTN
jgi:hypothetical protein